MDYIAFSIFSALALVLFNKRLLSNQLWRATITPLASIIGSGFLIAAPLLNSLNSEKSYLLIMLLCLCSYGIGTVIRWNIQEVEGVYSGYLSEKLSSVSLSIAYILSVSYYLYLLSSFIFKALNLEGALYIKSFTSVMILTIAYYGHLYGFKSLEKIETISVNIKLAIIVSFLASLVFFNFNNKIPEALPQPLGLHDLRVLLGLLIMVQGFETSRYLSSAYSKDVRIKSMRNSQLLSSLIYLSFIVLFSSVFKVYPIIGSVKETAVIDTARYVFHLAPLFLLTAAIASQLSAALADMSGCSGLVYEFTNKRISEKQSFIFIAALSILLIWLFNIFEVISLASKAFAIYYFLQCLSSAKYFYKKSILKFVFSAFMGIICLLVVLFGIAFE